MMKINTLFVYMVFVGSVTLHAATPQETVVTCDAPAELISNDTETVATFKENVIVNGNNMTMTCDYLKVTAFRKGDPKATIGKYGSFKSLLAIGHVKIIQADRIATSGRAEVFPGEDRIVLSDHPTIKGADDQYAAEGYRMTLYKGQRRAVIESDPNEKTRIILPAIKDLGFDANAPLEGAKPDKK